MDNVQEFIVAVENRLSDPQFQAKLAELLKPNTPTRLAVELFRGVLREKKP